MHAALAPESAGETVAFFPNDTELYGVTLNIQGPWVRAEHRGNFLHLGLSRDARSAILRDATSLQTFIDSRVAASDAT